MNSPVSLSLPHPCPCKNYRWEGSGSSSTIYSYYDTFYCKYMIFTHVDVKAIKQGLQKSLLLLQYVEENVWKSEYIFDFCHDLNTPITDTVRMCRVHLEYILNSSP